MVHCLYILQVCAFHMSITMEIYCQNYFGISVCLNDETVGIQLLVSFRYICTVQIWHFLLLLKNLQVVNIF